MITENSTKEPTHATDEVLLKVHTSEYLESLKVLQFAYLSWKLKYLLLLEKFYKKYICIFQYLAYEARQFGETNLSANQFVGKPICRRANLAGK